MILSTIIDGNVEIEKRKTIATYALKKLATKPEANNSDICKFFDSKSLDTIMSLITDRELQLSVLQLALLNGKWIKFDNSELQAIFKSMSLKNFSQSARKFLKQLDSCSKQNSIKSFKTSQIKFVQESQTISSHGWVDFNETSIGLTSCPENQETYTEIRYKSITEWYIKDISTLFVSILCGKIVVEIDLNQASQDVISFIIRKMGARIFKKRSESNNIIVLANFSKKKKLSTPKKLGDIVIQLARLLENSSISVSDISDDIRFLNRKIKKNITRKMKKSFSSHLEYMNMAINELQSAPLSDPLKFAQITQK